MLCLSPPIRTALLCLAAALVLGGPALAQSRARSIEGRIRNYECGDNCYLTIVDGSNKEHTGLCTARECARWNEEARMPKRFRGKRVVVTVGRGTQTDASGNVMGRMMSFDSIRFLD